MLQNCRIQNSRQSELKKAQEQISEQRQQINIAKDYNEKILKEREKKEEEEQKREEENNQRHAMLRKQKKESDIKSLLMINLIFFSSFLISYFCFHHFFLFLFFFSFFSLFMIIFFSFSLSNAEYEKEKEKVPFESKIKINTKKDTKKIVQLLEENAFIQNNEISIEIVNDPNENQNRSDDDDFLFPFSNEIFEIPQPSKVVKKMPTKYQICLIHNETIREPQHFENEVRTKYVRNDEDFKKITRFNELFLKKLKGKSEVKEQAPIKSQEQIDKSLSMFRSKRRKRGAPKCLN